MPITAEHAKAVLSRADCLFDDSAVQAAIDKMANDINTTLANENPLVICVMSGGLIVTSELLKRFSFPLELDYVHATRYGSEIVGDELNWHVKPRTPLENRVLLIVDDILDVGQTLYEIVEYCKKAGAKKVYTAALVDKLHDRKQGLLKADFTGLEVPDRYVFGYGMDYKNYLRNVTGIYAASTEDE